VIGSVASRAGSWRERCSFACRRCLRVVLLVDVLDEIDHSVTVAILVIIPGHELDKVVVERDAGPCVEDGAIAARVEVGRDDLVLGVVQDALERAGLGRRLHYRLDLVVGRSLLQTHSQIHDGHIRNWNTEGHSSQLAIQRWDDLAHSLGGPCARGDDVIAGRAATTPVLVARPVDGLLCGRVGVHCGHETLEDHKLVVDDLGKGSQTVGGARRVADDGHGRVVLVLVDSHYEHGSVGRGGRNDDLFGPPSDVSVRLLDGCEAPRRLDDVLGTVSPPRDLLGVTAVVHGDWLAVDDQFLAVGRHSALELTVSAVIFEHVHHVLEFNEWIIDRDNFDLVLEGDSHHQATNTTKPVYSDLGSHVELQ